MGNAPNKYIDVLLPLSIPNLFTYHLSSESYFDIQAGARVLVQFGKRKIYTALVVAIHANKPTNYQTKEIIDVLDEKPIIQEYQLKFWEWIAQYYMCHLGEVYTAALPSGLKPESETRLYPGKKEETFQLSLLHETILEQVFDTPGINILTLESRLNKKNLLVHIKKLAENKLLQFDEAVGYKVKAKTAWYVTLHEAYRTNERLQHITDHLERKAPKQNDILMAYLLLSGFPQTDRLVVTRDELLEKAQATPANLKALEKKGVFILEEKEVSRLSRQEEEVQPIAELSPEQELAYQEITAGFQQKDVMLLHGVTSSGKTEIYIKLIHETIAQGKQVLFLLPEIALTTQIIVRLRKVFGNKVGVFHSKYSNSERVEVWNNVMGNVLKGTEPYQIVLGVRSSVFLPFKNLGLVIIDEEHENSFKQYDPAPRYHARDIAIVLGHMQKAKILLGSATPSIESYHNAQTGKYGLVELTKRFRDIQLPEITLVDTVKARKQKRMHSNFTQDLIDEIRQTLENKQQVILFQNRRGFSQFLECSDCGWVPYCVHCDVSMTYHKFTNRVVCHYCGYSQPNPEGCHACGSIHIEAQGYGTERIEDSVLELFPEVKVKRLDLDSTRSKTSHEKIIASFQKGETDILIGTQMVTKGLDFDNVMLVGVMNADTLLNFPDFRAFERTYQLLSQVGGRSGRKHGRGKVFIQTANRNHPTLKMVVNNDYVQLFNTELEERKSFTYPPFFRLIRITIRHKDKDKVNEVSKLIARDLKSIKNVLVLGPQYPLVARTFNTYQKCIYTKFPRQVSQAAIKTEIKSLINKTLMQAGKGVQTVMDVDPY